MTALNNSPNSLLYSFMKYLLSLSPLDDLMSAGEPKELALLYAQLSSKSWEEVSEEIIKACGEGLNSSDAGVKECITKYLRNALGLEEASNLL